MTPSPLLPPPGDIPTFEDPPVTTKPVVVYSSPVPAILGVALRQVGLMGASVTTLVSLISARDLRGLFDFIASHEFLAFIAMAMGLAILLWGQVRELRIWKKLVKLVDEVPDDVGTLVDRVFRWPKGKSGQ